MHIGRLSHGPVGAQENADSAAVARHRGMDHGGFCDERGMDIRGQILGGF